MAGTIGSRGLSIQFDIGQEFEKNRFNESVLFIVNGIHKMKGKRTSCRQVFAGAFARQRFFSQVVQNIFLGISLPIGEMRALHRPHDLCA